MARAGETGRGVTQIRAGLAELQAAGTVLMRPYHLALLVDALSSDDAAAGALEAVAEALSIARATAERWYEAELVRLRGELILSAQRPGVSDAETALDARRALVEARDIARHQQATSLQLRASSSLDPPPRPQSRATRRSEYL